MPAKSGNRAVAIYHRMKAGEGFDETAQMIWSTMVMAAQKWPGKRRVLYLDVEGHRNSNGGFDQDAYEIQVEFIFGTVGPYLSEINTPLSGRAVCERQLEDPPGDLIIESG